jgi:hypothetical protein
MAHEGIVLGHAPVVEEPDRGAVVVEELLGRVSLELFGEADGEIEFFETGASRGPPGGAFFDAASASGVSGVTLPRPTLSNSARHRAVSRWWRIRCDVSHLCGATLEGAGPIPCGREGVACEFTTPDLLDLLSLLGERV